MKIHDRGIRSNFNAAIQDGKIQQPEMEKILQSARDGNILTKNERADLERILANHGSSMEPEAKQAMTNFLQGLDKCKTGDMEGPPAPRILSSMAFERATEGARVVANPQPRPANAVRNPDPLYLELDNVEMGTKFEIINLSKNPGATFDNKTDLQTVEITGRDVQNRRASIYMNDEKMREFGIEPGDVFQIRARDPAGNVSLPVTGEIEPNDWAGNQVQELNATGGFVNAGPGTQFSALDGEAARKNLVVKAVNDSRAPMVLEDKLILVTDDRFDENDKGIVEDLRAGWGAIKTAMGKDSFTLDEAKTLVDNQTITERTRAALKELVDDPALFDHIESAVQNGAKDGVLGLTDVDHIRAFQRNVTISAFAAIEPRTTVQVQNQRTGQVMNATVGDDRQLNLKLGDIRDGDPLILTPTDNEGVVGQRVELVYSSKCKDGKAPKLQGGLGARLPGVI
jgi:hypothetical protein